MAHACSAGCGLAASDASTLCKDLTCCKMCAASIESQGQRCYELVFILFEENIDNMAGQRY